MKTFLQASLLATAILALAACDDDDDDGGGPNPPDPQGSASVAVTDAAMEGADRVVVEFSAIEFKPKDGAPFTVALTDDEDNEITRQIDLLTLEGASSELLIDAEPVPAGEYNWVRLLINDNPCESIEPGDNPSGSFIDLTAGGIEPLHVPSGSQSGLKIIKNFVIAAGGQTDLTVDFDLRKSVVAPEGQECHFLKPVLRVVDNSETNHIVGSVDPTLLEGDNCIPENVDEPAAVYLYEAFATEPDDIDTEPAEPLTTATVQLVDGTYRYEIGFVPTGEYTAALTCDADIDDPEVDNDADAGNPDIVEFEAAQDVTVSVGNESVEANFEAAP